MTFGAWLGAYSSNQTALEEFYVRRFRSEFSGVFNKWAESKPRENPSAPPTPFAMPEYELKERRAAADLERKANEKFTAGEDANEKGDKFVLVTVILANALFFGGINQLPQNKACAKSCWA